MPAVANLVAIIAYLFTLAATFLVIAFLPTILMSVVFAPGSRLSRRGFLICGCIACGFVAGMAAAWWLLPVSWEMPLWETAYAAFRSDIYGHEAEHAAEDIFLYLLFAANVTALAAGGAAALVPRRRCSV